MNKVEDWKSGLLSEYYDLFDKTRKLDKFLKTHDFESLPIDDKNDLREQLVYMRNYLMVLRRRCARNKLIEI